MQLVIQEHIPKDFHESSKVWIYQSSNLILISEALKLETMIHEFTQNWKSHGTPVKGFATLLFGRFLVLMADETATGVSGCSTDSSVHFVRAVEQAFNTEMFDRTKLAFSINDKVEVIPMQQLPYAIENGFITENTLYFNNTILNKKDLLENWITPAGETWLKKYFKG